MASALAIAAWAVDRLSWGDTGIDFKSSRPLHAGEFDNAKIGLITGEALADIVGSVLVNAIARGGGDVDSTQAYFNNTSVEISKMFEESTKPEQLEAWNRAVVVYNGVLMSAGGNMWTSGVSLLDVPSAVEDAGDMLEKSAGFVTVMADRFFGIASVVTSLRVSADELGITFELSKISTRISGVHIELDVMDEIEESYDALQDMFIAVASMMDNWLMRGDVINFLKLNPKLKTDSTAARRAMVVERTTPPWDE